jgi:hypothetical protein
VKRVLAAVLLFLGATAFAEDPKEDIAESLQSISKNYPRDLIMTFGTISYAYTESQSTFSRFLEDLIEDVAQNLSNVEIFQRDAVKNMDPAFREIYGDIFDMGTTNSFLYGQFFDETDGIRFSYEVSSLETGTQIGRGEVKIKWESIPPSVNHKPERLEEVEDVLTNLQIVELPQVESNQGATSSTRFFKDDELRLMATTNRGANPVYFDGEIMTVQLHANVNCYIKVYHIDIEGNTTLIYPNPIESSTKLPGGKLLQIPSANYPFKFRLHAPFGREYIKVLASTVPFPEINEQQLTPLGTNTREIIMAGLGEAQLNGDLVESVISYSINEDPDI